MMSMDKFLQLNLDQFKASAREKELQDEIDELRSERQREHDLRVQIAGSLESVQEQSAQMIAELKDMKRFGMIGDYDGYIGELSDGDYVDYDELQSIINKYTVKK